jgi:hypothetical protein
MTQKRNDSELQLTVIGGRRNGRRRYDPQAKRAPVEAVAYARSHWSYLIRYVDDGTVPIDNNVLERDIRPFATGRRNWLFSDTVAGAQASAVIYSLMLTCRACDVEPWTYLNAVLTELPQHPDSADISDLLPWRFSQQRIVCASSLQDVSLDSRRDQA